MRKYQPIIDYYNQVSNILKDYLPRVPGVQLTEGKTYYGSYWSNKEKAVLSLSVIHCYPINHNELIDTICHELAHVIYPKHNRLHTAATKHFVSIVNEHWQADNQHQHRLYGGVVIMLDKDSHLPVTEEMKDEAMRALMEIVWEMIESGELPEFEVREAG